MKAAEELGFTVTVNRFVRAKQPRVGKAPFERPIREVTDLSYARGEQPYEALAAINVEYLSDVASANCMEVWQALRGTHDNFNFGLLYYAMKGAGLSFADVHISSLNADAEYWVGCDIPNRYAVKLMRHSILGVPMLLALTDELLGSLYDVGPKAVPYIKAAQARLSER